MEYWFSILGSIASIGGAIWAYIQASLSKKYAVESKQYRDQIVDRRKVMELSKVNSETNRILRVASKVGPTCTKTSVKTVKCHELAKEIEEYVRLLNEQKSHFNDLFHNNATKLCEELKWDIEKLSEAKEFEDIKSAGKNIYYKIEEFLPQVKLVTDEEREK